RVVLQRLRGEAEGGGGDALVFHDHHGAAALVDESNRPTDGTVGVGSEVVGLEREVFVAHSGVVGPGDLIQWTGQRRVHANRDVTGRDQRARRRTHGWRRCYQDAASDHAVVHQCIGDLVQ